MRVTSTWSSIRSTARYYFFERVHGPYTVLGNLHPSDTTGTSFRSQISSVFRHPTQPDLYIALADRWLPRLSEEESNQTDAFHRFYAAKLAGEDPPAGMLPDPEADNTSVADYVWLPIRFDGDRPVIEWHDEWRIP